ncbi:MAG: MBL fold metallo-hydrolase [Pseudomonadota bacterium]
MAEKMTVLKGQLTILADNIVLGKNDSLGEHGFACYVETDRGNFLFDTGKGKTILHNAAVFKKDLAALSGILISHGHLDHTGGLPEVLRFHDRIDVLGHPDIFVDRFKEEKNGNKNFMGTPFKRGYLEKCGARFLFNDTWEEVEKGLYLTGEVPRETDFEFADMDDRFAVRDGRVVPEIILDDQSLIIRTSKGLLILLGCAHAGIINIIHHAIKMTGVEDIVAVIGGTHLGFSEEIQLEKTIQALRSFRIGSLIPSHCTGIPVLTRLAAEFEHFQFSFVGKSFEF